MKNGMSRILMLLALIGCLIFFTRINQNYLKKYKCTFSQDRDIKYALDKFCFVLEEPTVSNDRLMFEFERLAFAAYSGLEPYKGPTYALLTGDEFSVLDKHSKIRYTLDSLTSSTIFMKYKNDHYFGELRNIDSGYFELSLDDLK